MKISCDRILERKFLWWSWEEVISTHDWEYINKENRICSNCGRKEILFETTGPSMTYLENWRKSV
jgi:hypothetical protein